MSANVSGRGSLKKIDVTTFIPNIPFMIAINEGDNSLYYWQEGEWFAAGGGGGGGGQQEIEVTDSTYTILGTEGTIKFTYAGDVTITIPSGLSLPVTIICYHSGPYDLIFSAGGGVSLNSYGTHTRSNGQYAIATIISVAPDTYLLGGNTKL